MSHHIGTPVTGYTGLVYLSHLFPDRNRLPCTGPQLADYDMVPLDSNAVRSNAGDRPNGSGSLSDITRPRNGIHKSRLDVLALWILVESGGALHIVTMIFLLGFSTTSTGAISAVSLGHRSLCVVQLSPFFDCLVLLKGAAVGDATWDFYILLQ
jgi:hypothetical protein